MATVYEKMTTIADAIREKTGGTEVLTLDSMVTAIDGIGGKKFPNGTEWDRTNIYSSGPYFITYANSIWVAGGG